MAEQEPEPAPDAAGDEAAPDRWVLLIDPEWEPADERDQPPDSAVVGAWYVEDDGAIGRFRSNHWYVPFSPDSPTDPIDASLRMAMRGALPVPELLAMLPGALLHIGLDEQGAPIVTRAPDGNPSVLVLSALAHAQRLTVPGWAEINTEVLAESLPDAGVDVLLNLGAPASTRIGPDEFRAAVLDPVPGERPRTFAEPPENTAAPAATTASPADFGGALSGAATPAPDRMPAATAEDFAGGIEFDAPLPPPSFSPDPEPPGNSG